MKYQHSKEESAEYLRRALPMMSGQDAALHPVSYAVWYEYVSGMNTALNAAADTLLARGRPLGEDEVASLFERHVADIDSTAASSIAAGFQRILGEFSKSTGVAAQETEVFGDMLQQLSNDCAERPTAIDLKTLIDGTRAMQASVATLQTRLEASQKEIESLREEVERARDASVIDGLTGLVNRRGFDQKLADCLGGADESDGPCLLMCDIDHFKKINDTYGHLFGDKVIRAVASVIKENVKGRDLAARYGGEEFVVLLPDTSLQGAHTLAEQIRHAIEKGRIKRGNSEETVARVTLSLGVARYRAGEGALAFIERADRALYTSKQNGRNRVTLAATA
ncbi:MAG: GGDEF domain-containing protein [Pseudomonadota bacterium]